MLLVEYSDDVGKLLGMGFYKTREDLYTVSYFEGAGNIFKSSELYGSGSRLLFPVWIFARKGGGWACRHKESSLFPFWAAII